jgi:cell wall-associated NlpC family hydrolase
MTYLAEDGYSRGGGTTMNTSSRYIRKSATVHDSKICQRAATVIAMTLTASVLVVGLGVSPVEAATGCKGVKREKAMCIALKQRGKPYVLGAVGPTSFDCSGLMQYAYKEVGVKIPRTSQQQAMMTGKWVAVKKPLPGDLVLFNVEGVNTHVGMYIGDGNVVHAPRPNTNVKITTVKYLGTVSTYLHYRG